MKNTKKHYKKLAYNQAQKNTGKKSKTKCVFCHRTASHKQITHLKHKDYISYYCKGHKQEGIAFGFLEEEELIKI